MLAPMQFVCPICAGTNWREVVVPKAGGHYRTDFCECCGCSAMFRRAELFTIDRGKKPEAGLPLRSPGAKERQ
jgi:hypothetical protein